MVRKGIRPLSGKRHRRRGQSPMSPARAVYDHLTAFVLVATLLMAILMYGAVRMWSMCPVMFCFSIVLLLTLFRPFIFKDIYVWRMPHAWITGALLCIYAAVYSWFSVIPFVTRFDVLCLGVGLGLWGACIELGARYGRWRLLLGVVIIAVTLSAWYALIQHANGSQWVLARFREEYGMRASGTYYCPNHFANLLAVVSAMCLALMLNKAAGGALRLVSGYALIVIAPALFLTQSRSGWLGAMAGCAIVVLLFFWKRSKRLFAYAVALTPLVLAAISFSLWLASPMVRERVNGMLHPEEDRAAIGRLVMWKDTINMIRDEPVWGHGPGVFRWIYPSYRTIDSQLWARYAHNEYLQMLSEYGLPGIVLFVVALGSGIIYLLRGFLRSESEKAYMLYAGALGIASAACVHAMFDYTFHILSCVYAALFFIGVSMGVSGGSGEMAMQPVTKRMLAVRGVLAVIVLGLIVMNSRMYLSDYYIRQADTVRKKLSLDKAESIYSRALKSDTQNWRAAMGIGHIYKTRTFWEWDEDMKQTHSATSLAHYEAALRLNPYEVEAVLGESKVYTAVGNYEKAFEKYEWLVEFAPGDQHFLIQYGLALRSAGFYKEALTRFRQAWKVASGNEKTEMINLNIAWLQKKIRTESKKP